VYISRDTQVKMEKRENPVDQGSKDNQEPQDKQDHKI
jgi:hypothetical protein